MHVIRPTLARRDIGSISLNRFLRDLQAHITLVCMDMKANECIVLYVKCCDANLRKGREATSGSVREYFNRHFNVPPNLRVICFFDDQDPDLFLAGCRLSAGTRGVHWPIRGGGLSGWPNYMFNVVAPPRDGDSSGVTWPFDSVVYLYGSTCENEIALTITFAHELQHFLQYANERQLWAANALLARDSTLFERPWEIPSEREARIVSKRVAEDLHGAESIRQHAVAKLNDSTTGVDMGDWRFFRDIVTADAYDLSNETKRLVQQHKSELAKLQAECAGSPDFCDLDFESTDWLPIL